MLNITHRDTSSSQFTGLVLEGKVVVDARTLGNPLQVGVLIPALTPNVDISAGATEMERSVPSNRFRETDKSATIPSTVKGRNYIVTSIMQQHNVEPAWVQEGEHVFIGFIDNDIKKPFIYPWGGISNIKYRMRDKLRMYVSNKASVAGEVDETCLHYVEIDSEAKTAAMHIVNSEGEPIGFDAKLDYGNGLWSFGDTAGNTVDVIADPETPTNNSFTIKNGSDTLFSMIGDAMALKAKDTIDLDSAIISITAEEALNVTAPTITEECDDYAMTAAQSHAVEGMEVSIVGSQSVAVEGMEVAMSADTSFDALGGTMMTVGVNPSCIQFSPASQMNSAPMTLANMVLGAVLVPGAGAVPPPPPAPPGGGGGGGGGGSAPPAAAPPAGAPPAHTQGSDPGPANETDLAAGEGKALVVAEEIYGHVKQGFDMIGMMAKMDIVPPMSGGPSSMGAGGGATMASALIDGLKDVGASKQAKG